MYINKTLFSPAGRMYFVGQHLVHFSTSGSTVLKSLGFCLKYGLWLTKVQNIFTFYSFVIFLKHLFVFKMAVSRKCLNGTTDVLEDIKPHQAEQENFHSLVVFIDIWTNVQIIFFFFWLENLLKD